MEILQLVGLSITLFTGIILTLVFILLYSESKLVQKGDVRILINSDEEKSLTTTSGRTLLQTLLGAKIFLPSACGGGGTCGVCTCQIDDGGGDVLPTEKTHLSQKQVKSNWRLACQVKVRQDMDIRIPDEIFSIQTFKCKVVSNHNVASFIKDFVVELPEGAEMDYEAGGYIQIDVPEYKNLNYKDFDIDEEYRSEWDTYNMWQFVAGNDDPCSRAYSMASYPAEKGLVRLNIRIASPPPNKPDVPPGIASSYIFGLKPGDDVDISGPYGEFFIQDTEKEMVYIGGGAGMAPLRSHIFQLLKTEGSSRKIRYYYGARSLREMFYQEEFEELEKKFPNFKFIYALSEPQPEDNWTGKTGFIHQVVLDDYLDKHPDPTEIEFYMCGPPMMNNAVNKMLYDIGVENDQIFFDDFGI